jgi:hypothetical protein
MACDDEILPIPQMIQGIADDTDLGGSLQKPRGACSSLHATARSFAVAGGAVFEFPSARKTVGKIQFRNEAGVTAQRQERA